MRSPRPTERQPEKTMIHSTIEHTVGGINKKLILALMLVALPIAVASIHSLVQRKVAETATAEGVTRWIDPRTGNVRGLRPVPVPVPETETEPDHPCGITYVRNGIDDFLADPDLHTMEAIGLAMKLLDQKLKMLGNQVLCVDICPDDPNLSRLANRGLASFLRTAKKDLQKLIDQGELAQAIRKIRKLEEFRRSGFNLNGSTGWETLARRRLKNQLGSVKNLRACGFID